MISPMMLGPINGGVLLAMLIASVVAAGMMLRQIHRGRVASVVPLIVSLALPLVFASWAASTQHDYAMEWAMTHPEYLVRQTYMALMLSRTIATQTFAGSIVSLVGVGALAGAVALTVRGERPRWLIGLLGLGVGGALITVAATSMSHYPAAIVAGRVGVYVVAVGISVAALISAHRRGPGAQLATVVAVAVPLIVAGADLATLGWIATVNVHQMAKAPVELKQGLMDNTIAILDSLTRSSWVTLSLATGLALLAPITAWRRERPMAVATLLAVVAVLVVAIVGLGNSTAWIGAFR